jgi:hypothetical protein
LSTPSPLKQPNVSKLSATFAATSEMLFDTHSLFIWKFTVQISRKQLRRQHYRVDSKRGFLLHEY